MLHAFNLEFGAPTPGSDAIATRLAALLGDETFALVISPAAAGKIVGIALVTLRTNVWYRGWVGLLDELYVTPEHRNHGLGTSLLHAAEAELVARGGQVLEINVDGEDVDFVKRMSADDMLNLFGARLTPNRQKCCLLSWKVLQQAIYSPVNGQEI